MENSWQRIPDRVWFSPTKPFSKQFGYWNGRSSRRGLVWLLGVDCERFRNHKFLTRNLPRKFTRFQSNQWLKARVQAISFNVLGCPISTWYITKEYRPDQWIFPELMFSFPNLNGHSVTAWDVPHKVPIQTPLSQPGRYLNYQCGLVTGDTLRQNQHFLWAIAHKSLPFPKGRWGSPRSAVNSRLRLFTKTNKARPDTKAVRCYVLLRYLGMFNPFFFAIPKLVKR